MTSLSLELDKKTLYVNFHNDLKKQPLRSILYIIIKKGMI